VSGGGHQFNKRSTRNKRTVIRDMVVVVKMINPSNPLLMQSLSLHLHIPTYKYYLHRVQMNQECELGSGKQTFVDTEMNLPATRNALWSCGVLT
jgi:hypothetical protein